MLWRNHGVVRALERYLEANGVPELARFKVVTCMVEAVANVVCHTEVGLRDITLTVCCEAGKVSLELTDPSHVSDFTWPIQQPGALDQRGRGLWIIHNWMNAVSHVVCEQGSRLRMELIFA
nr:ATP-binding protein [Alloalcanivorax marinus]